MCLSICHLYICWDSLVFEDFIYASPRSKSDQRQILLLKLLSYEMNFFMATKLIWILIFQEPLLHPLQWEHTNFHVGDWIIVYSFWFLLYVWCCMEQFQDWMLQMFLMPQYLSYGTSILSMLYQKEKGTLLCLHIGYLAAKERVRRCWGCWRLYTIQEISTYFSLMIVPLSLKGWI